MYKPNVKQREDLLERQRGIEAETCQADNKSEPRQPYVGDLVSRQRQNNRDHVLHNELIAQDGDQNLRRRLR